MPFMPSRDEVAHLLGRLMDRLPERDATTIQEYIDHEEEALAVEQMARAIGYDGIVTSEGERSDLLRLGEQFGVANQVAAALAGGPARP
jgi:hypothetical protein